MSVRRVRARRSSSRGEADRWKERHDALLTVLNAILMAYGDGTERRLAVSNAYVGQRRREVFTEPMRGDRFIVYLAPEKEEPADADTSEAQD